MPDVGRALRMLAELEPGELPVLSIYLDMRPHATGEHPARRAGVVMLNDRLREIEQTYLPRGPELDSIRADAARIDRYLEDECDGAADGLALFACAGRELFETVEADVPFEHQVTVAPQPDLFQLARLLDEQETAVVAVVDSNTSRLFVTRRGGLQEVGGTDEGPRYFRTRPKMGGLEPGPLPTPQRQRPGRVRARDGGRAGAPHCPRGSDARRPGRRRSRHPAPAGGDLAAG